MQQAEPMRLMDVLAPIMIIIFEKSPVSIID